MSKAVINFKIDVAVKAQAQALAKELGVPLSTIINAQLRELLRTRRLNVGADLKPTPYLEKVLAVATADSEANGRNFSPPFDSVEEMLADLKK